MSLNGRKLSKATGMTAVAAGLVLVVGCLGVWASGKARVAADSLWQALWQYPGLAAEPEYLYHFGVLGVTTAAAGALLTVRGTLHRKRVAVSAAVALAVLMLGSQAWIFSAAAGFATGQAHTVVVEECGSDEASPPAHDQTCGFADGRGAKYIYGFDWEGEIWRLPVVDGPVIPCQQRGECPEGPRWVYAAPKIEDLSELAVALIVLAGGGIWLKRSRRSPAPDNAPWNGAAPTRRVISTRE